MYCHKTLLYKIIRASNIYVALRDLSYLRSSSCLSSCRENYLIYFLVITLLLNAYIFSLNAIKYTYSVKNFKIGNILRMSFTYLTVKYENIHTKGLRSDYTQHLLNGYSHRVAQNLVHTGRSNSYTPGIAKRKKEELRISLCEWPFKILRVGYALVQCFLNFCFSTFSLLLCFFPS